MPREVVPVPVHGRTFTEYEERTMITSRPDKVKRETARKRREMASNDDIARPDRATATQLRRETSRTLPSL